MRNKYLGRACGSRYLSAQYFMNHDHNHDVFSVLHTSPGGAGTHTGDTDTRITPLDHTDEPRLTAQLMTDDLTAQLT